MPAKCLLHWWKLNFSQQVSFIYWFLFHVFKLTFYGAKDSGMDQIKTWSGMVSLRRSHPLSSTNFMWSILEHFDSLFCFFKKDFLLGYFQIIDLLLSANWILLSSWSYRFCKLGKVQDFCCPNLNGGKDIPSHKYSDAHEPQRFALIKHRNNFY